MEDIFGVSFSLPRNLRVGRGGGRQMDGQGRCSSAEGRKDIDIFKSNDVFPFILQLGIDKDYLVRAEGLY